MGFADPWITIAYAGTIVVCVFNIIFGFMRKAQLEKTGDDEAE